MVADIKLEDNVVTVEDTDPAKSVTQLRVKAWDIVLDAPDRRKIQNGDRRALVHGQDDNLIINYGNDYPGGVNILGTVDLEKINPHNGELSIKKPGSLKSTIITGDTILLRTIIHSKEVPKKPSVNNLDLVDEIKKLRTQVDELMKKVG